MDATFERPSAKILQFPRRNGAAAENLGAKAKFAAEVARLRQRAPIIESGHGWYHEEAIRGGDRRN